MKKIVNASIITFILPILHLTIIDSLEVSYYNSIISIFILTLTSLALTFLKINNFKRIIKPILLLSNILIIAKIISNFVLTNTYLKYFDILMKNRNLQLTYAPFLILYIMELITIIPNSFLIIKLVQILVLVSFIAALYNNFIFKFSWIYVIVYVTGFSLLHSRGLEWYLCITALYLTIACLNFRYFNEFQTSLISRYISFLQF